MGEEYSPKKGNLKTKIRGPVLIILILNMAIYKPFGYDTAVAAMQ